MLQGKLTKLDSDFITLWSSYILYREIDREALRKLAEMGQINAVQSYYIYFNERNSKIDAIVDSYKGDSPDELLAKANKYRFYHPENEKQIDKIIADARIIQYKIDEYDMRHRGEQYIELSGRKAYGKDYNRLIKEYKNVPSTRMLERAADEYWSAGVKNPLFSERAVEVCTGINYYNIENLHRSVMTTRKRLIKAYKKDKENEAVQFALGKNLIVFSASDKKKNFGELLLQKLAQREYSQELKSYSDNHTITGDERE